MDLKEILGEKYSDDLTASEISNLLKDTVIKSEWEEKYHSLKDSFDSTSSDLANYKKKLKELENANLSEDEKRQNEVESLMSEIETLKRQNHFEKVKQQATRYGIQDENVINILNNLTDTEQIETLLKTFKDQVDDSVNNAISNTKKEMLDNTPKLPLGDKDQEQYDSMTLTEKMELKSKDPERYKKIFG